MKIQIICEFTESFFAALKCNDVDTVTKRLQAGMDPDERKPRRLTPLMIAVKESYPDMVKVLVKYGADINAVAPGGSALMMAIKRKKLTPIHQEIIDFLLSLEPDLSIKDKEGRNTLECAIRYGHTNVVNTLIEKGGYSSIDSNEEVFFKVIENGWADTVKLLLEHGADIEAKNKDVYMVLDNLAVLYGGNNRVDEVIGLKEKSLQILEALYQANPDRWAERYAEALGNLAVPYKDIIRTDEAIVLLEKSLQIYKGLYAVNPDLWGEKYTTALSNLASSYYMQNRLEEAISLIEKSLQIHEGFYAANPDQWGENYTTALNNLSHLYKDVNRADEAFGLEEKRLETYDALYRINPYRWAKDYARALGNLAVPYKDINRTDEAIALQEKRLQTYEALYETKPDLWGEDYATALGNLAYSYKNVNRPNEAIELLEKRLQIFELLYKNDPDQWADELNKLAASYKYVNRLDEAIRLQVKSLLIRIELYQDNPLRLMGHYRSALGDLAVSYSNIASSYKDANRLDAAINTQEKSLQILERLFDSSSDLWAGRYTAGLLKLADLYSTVNRTDEAFVLEEKSLQIREGLYAVNPDQWGEDYTTALNSLGSSYAKSKEFAKASEHFKRYFQIYVFEQNEDIRYFIYAFVKWYQCVSHLHNHSELVNLENIAIELQDMYRQALRYSYAATIEEIHKEYIPLGDSEDSWDKEKYEIFVKIFLQREKNK